MLKETIPNNLEFKSVTLFDSSRRPFPGRVAFKIWTSAESFKRGFKRSLKIVSILFVLPLPFALLEPFAFIVWGSITLAFIVFVLGPYFHLKYWNEKQTFFYVQAECPSCHQTGQLMPYLSTALAQEFTVLCSGCGQTSSVEIPAEQ